MVKVKKILALITFLATAPCLFAQWICESEDNGFEDVNYFASCYSKDKDALLVIKNSPEGSFIWLRFVELWEGNKEVPTDFGLTLRVGNEWKRYNFYSDIENIPKDEYKNSDRNLVLSYIEINENLTDELSSIYDIPIGLIAESKNTHVFWEEFSKASVCRIRVRQQDDFDYRYYDFVMTGSAKAYKHVLGGVIPDWDK